MYVRMYDIRRGSESTSERNDRFLGQVVSDPDTAGGHSEREEHADVQESGTGEASRADQGADGS